MSIKQNLSSLHQICYSESTAESVSRMTSCASILSGAILGFILTITVPAVTMAANECGAEVAGPDTITCAPGVYPTGIAYSNSDGLTLIIDDSTGTVGNPGVQVSSSAVGVGDIAIIGTNIGTTSTTAAVRHALFSNINNTSSTATASVLLSDGAVNTSGFFSLGIYVRNAGLGDALIQIDGGTITTTDDFAYGGLSYIANTNSTATATAALTGGDITTTGGTGVGIFALNWGAW